MEKLRGKARMLGGRRVVVVLAAKAPHAWARPPAARLLGRRRLTTQHVAADDAWAVLGIPKTSCKTTVKKRFYELAKATHPDVVGSGDGGDDAADAAGANEQRSFVEILAAFEAIIHGDAGNSARSGSASTSANSAARGGSSSSRSAHRGGASGTRVDREPSLGEVLCQRLVDEPTAARDVWAEIVSHGCQIHATMLESLFRACGSKGGGGLPGALEILREAKDLGLLTPQTREAAVISIIKWCKEDSSSFSRILSELGDAERTPEVRETLAYANALYSGYSDGYSAS